MITPSFHPHVGGVETHVRRVSECLSARGHQVTVLTHNESSSQDALGPISVHRLPTTGWLPAWRLSRRLIASADIVHCHDAYSFLHFFLPSCWLPPRRPVFTTFHGYEGYPIPSEALRKRRWVRRRVRNAICAGDFICRWYDTSCFAVTYGGVDPPPQPPPAPSEPSALFVGRLADDASIMLYLQALSHLKKEFRQQLPLTVAGDGPLRDIAQRYADAQGLSVRFLGTVPDITGLLTNADFAFVSGYLAIWQALAHRRLVFALYDNELKRDYLLGFPQAEDTLVVSGDPAELARALHHHLSDPAAGEPMRERGLLLAADNPWDRVADLYLAMYRAHGCAPS